MSSTTVPRLLPYEKCLKTHLLISFTEEFYNGLEVETDNYLEAVLNLTRFGTNYSFSQLRKPVNKTDWKSHGNPAIVNAFYSSIENSIQFPAGILQGKSMISIM